MFQSKVLTLGMVIDIIVLTPSPTKGGSADDAILARIDCYLDAGYVLTPEAKVEIDKHRYNNSSQSFAEAAE